MTEHYLDRLARTIEENWDQPALTDFYLTEDGSAQDTSRGNHYTYGEMYEEILHICDIFNTLGLQKGDHIAICGANSVHWVIAYLAIAAYQGVSVTTIYSQTIEDIAHQIDFSDAKVLFTDADLWEELAPLHRPYMGDLSSVISLSDWSLLSGCPHREKTERRPRDNRDIFFPQFAPDELAMICFTSGSTNSSKGIMLSNRNISNNAQNITDGYPDGEGAVFLSVLPMAHIYGFMTEILAQIIKGKHVSVLMDLSYSNLYSALSLIRPYALSFIPFLLSGLVKFNHDSIFLLRECKQIYVGGSLFDQQLEKALLSSRVPISIGYGMTETGPLISYSVCAEYKTGTCGKIVDGMTCCIAPNGEILVKGENVMLGYYKDPEATARKIDKDGWLHTGDKGHLDEDGYLYVEGRLEQDIIVLPNGENIHPEDIERKINALPEVKESIVLARDGRLIARVVVPSSLPFREESEVGSLRRSVLRAINPQLPLFSQLYDVEITDVPLQRTEKMTIKRYLYS